MCDANEYECQELWFWMIKVRKNDFECQKEEMWWLKMSEWVCTTVLNVKTKERCWHWMPSWRNMVALNAKLEANNDFECQTKDVALNAKLKMAPNVKLKTWLKMLNWNKQRLWIPKWRCDSECRTERDWTPNWRKTWWLWMLNWRHGFERWTKKKLITLKTKDETLNAQTELIALNARL